ncbi:hypothetical protein GCM10011579_042800 [Streptomyces albiflavescens]|uniref:Uncharacterized protein n=1 Tax=Streptomyces albiflavescens TaxID=1623582 RepID=A0A917Y500_9ACTN|nr:hypothetical protein GCM10011579_042800 [Streptomyces albiflavescens]
MRARAIHATARRRSGAADELRGLLDRLQQGSGGQTISGGVHLEARAEGSSRIYQSVRDQRITER